MENKHDAKQKKPGWWKGEGPFLSVSILWSTKVGNHQRFLALLSVDQNCHASHGIVELIDLWTVMATKDQHSPLMDYHRGRILKCLQHESWCHNVTGNNERDFDQAKKTCPAKTTTNAQERTLFLQSLDVLFTPFKFTSFVSSFNRELFLCLLFQNQKTA